MSLKLVCLSGAAAGVLMSIAGPSRSAAPAESGSATPADTGVRIGEVVVTARKTSESAQKVPVSLSAFNAQALSQKNIFEMNDLAAIAPSLVVTNSNADPTGATYELRGLPQPDTLIEIDPSVGQYVDGVYVPRNIGMQYALRNPNDIGDVEVLRGPQGTLFGHNTTGGAILIDTKAPVDDFESYADGIVGNYGRAEFATGVNIPFGGERGGIRISFQDGAHKGYANTQGGDQLDNENFYRFAARLQYRPTDKLTLDFATQNYRISHGEELEELRNVAIPGYNVQNAPIASTNPAGLIPTSAVALQEVEGYEASIGNPGMTDAQAFALLNSYTAAGNPNLDRYNHGNVAYPHPVTARLNIESFTLTAELNNWLTFKNIVGYTDAYRNEITNISASPFNLNQSQLLQSSQEYTEEPQLAFLYGPINGVLGGYYSRENGFDDSQNAVDFHRIYATPPAVPTSSIYNGQALTTSTAVYGQANWKATSRLTFTGGLRWSSETKAMDSFNFTSTVATAYWLATGLPNAQHPGVPITIPTPGLTCSIAAVLLVSPTVCEAKLSNSFSNVSWLASADYQINNTTLVYAKATQGYRAGGQNLRGNTLAGFSAFGPEGVLQYEGGFKTTFLDGKARVNADVFYSDYTNIDESVIVTVGTTTSTTVVNAAKAHIIGAEFEGSWIPVEHVNLFLTAATAQGKFDSYINGNVDRTGDAWPGVPWSVDIGGAFTYPVPLGDLSLTADWSYQAPRYLGAGDETLSWCSRAQVGVVPGCIAYTDDQSLRQMSPAQNLINARLTLHLNEWNTDVSLWGRNLLDQAIPLFTTDISSTAGGTCTGSGAAETCTVNRYAKYGNGFRTQVMSEPMTFGLEIRVKFGGH